MPESALGILSAPAAKDPVVLVALCFGFGVLAALAMVFREFHKVRSSHERVTSRMMDGFDKDSQRRSEEQARSAECLQGAIKGMVGEMHSSSLKLLERFDAQRKEELAHRAVFENDLRGALDHSTAEIARARQVLERLAPATNGRSA